MFYPKQDKVLASWSCSFFFSFKAAYPSMVDARFSQTNFDVKEDVGMFTVPVVRSGNTLITSVLQ